MKIKIKPITGEEFYYTEEIECLKDLDTVDLMDLQSRTMSIAIPDLEKVGLVTLPYEQIAPEELNLMKIARLNKEAVIGLNEDSEVGEQIIIRKKFEHLSGQTVYLTELTLDGFVQLTILTEEAIIWKDV